MRKQRFGAAIERLRMQDASPGRAKASSVVAIADMPEENRTQASVPFVDGQPVLDDLAVGMVEARIDQPGAVPPAARARPET